MSLKIIVILFCTFLPNSLNFKVEKWDFESSNSPELQLQEFSGRTKLNTVKFRFEWTIENIGKLELGEKRPVNSPIFPMIIPDSDTKLFWYLTYLDWKKGAADIFLNYNSTQENILTTFNFSLLNGDTKSYETNNIIYLFQPFTKQGKENVGYYNNFKKEGLIKDDKLTILCEGESVVPSDQEIKSNMDEFENVKNILSNSILITSDFDHKMLQVILHFLYTGKTSNLNKMHSSLLVAADNMELKTLFEEKLLSKLNIETAADIYMFMYLHEKPELKLQVIDFIKNNTLEVMNTKGWMSLLDSSNSKMLAEIFKLLAVKDSIELTQRPEV